MSSVDPDPNVYYLVRKVISTKLHIPDTLGPIVARPDLIARMNRGLTRKLVLVSAPAGYGKTTVICQWIRQWNYRLHGIPWMKGTMIR